MAHRWLPEILKGLMVEPCPICDDSGLRLVERPDGTRVAQDCSCRVQKRAAKLIGLARIPQRYAHCTLDDYVPNYGGDNRSLSAALIQAKNFVRAYPFETSGNGLLLTGSIGVGKTHLAVGMLQALIAERGAKGLFCDYRDLLKQVQNSYNRSAGVTELEILQPVFDAEVLVLDELGASKPTDWVWDTVAHILNTRYNDRLTTIITTNYPNLAAGESVKSMSKASTKESREAQESMREGTLGDRIGNRMLSRLQEMCVVIEMSGVDFRQGVKRARFGYA